MYFPPVYKRLHYIDCNQLFRYAFQQAPTIPFFCAFFKKGLKWAVFPIKPAHNPINRNLYPLLSAEVDGLRENKVYLIHSSTYRCIGLRCRKFLTPFSPLPILFQDIHIHKPYSEHIALYQDLWAGYMYQMYRVPWEPNSYPFDAPP